MLNLKNHFLCYALICPEKQTTVVSKACSSYRYLFNDAEVKPFDSTQLASECFGGEMTVSYDFYFCHVQLLEYLLWGLSWSNL